MINFIKLTSEKNNDTIVLEPSKIVFIDTISYLNDDKTYRSVNFENGYNVAVKETYDEIIDLINNTKSKTPAKTQSDAYIGSSRYKDVAYKIDVMQGYLEGKEIEIYNVIGQRWEEIQTPKWNWECSEYRIKPQY